MSRISQQRGAALEVATLKYLRSLGCMVERIATPMVMVRGQPRRTAKVFADIIGLSENGNGLLCECKNYGRMPRPSDFEPHQRKTLLEWVAHGGVALVAYVESGTIKLIPASYVLVPKLAKKVAEAKELTDHEPTAVHARKKSKTQALEKK